MKIQVKIMNQKQDNQILITQEISSEESSQDEEESNDKKIL